MSGVWWLLIGLVVGMTVGLLTAAMCCAASRRDEFAPGSRHWGG